ncbi:MAG: lysylphosphatidylglycerol synthase transmembrane domain-containing protein [bacterium]|nr:lysylphosphatidylglycerol synthase transmembrane domain-containing protein [bacterium]
MKKVKKHSLILILITLLILFLVLKNDFNGIVKLMFKISFFWFGVSALIMMVYWLLKTFSLLLIVKKYSNKIKFIDLFKQTLITQFFNGVTPFSTGGQPMEIYMLTKNGLSLPLATNVIMQNFIAYQIVLILYGIFAIIINYKYNLFVSISIMKKFVFLGFLINTFVCVGLFILSFSKKISNCILNVASKIGFKLGLIKNKNKFIQKNSNILEEFHKSAKLFINNKGLFLKEIFLNIISLTLYYSIPFFLMISLFGKSNISILTTIVSSAYILLIGSFVPIPGGTGGIEYGFIKFFGCFIVEPSLSALLLIWRFITYYLGIIIGAISFTFYKGGEK